MRLSKIRQLKQFITINSLQRIELIQLLLHFKHTIIILKHFINSRKAEQ